jgi:RNA polymerase sigma-70 factor (ECF subfamily)
MSSSISLSRRRIPRTVSDRTLARRAGDGDREAFAELLRRHDPAMRRLAYRILGHQNAMDDALQEAYLNAFRALPRFDGSGAFSSWLYRITYNACIDEFRRARRRPELTDRSADEPHAAAGPERTVAAADAVQRALGSLPADQRATVVLVDGEGFDHKETAQILGIAPGTVASRLSRARHAIRRATEENQ